MNFPKTKILSIISDILFIIAIYSTNAVSQYHCYQAKEPESLKKYKKHE